MRKQFNIKYRPQIESGKYKVVTEDDEPARIICWDSTINKERPIIAIVYDDQIEQYKADGRYDNDYETSNYDLFIVTPEEELSEWQRFISACLQKHGLLDCGAADRIAKESAAELLTLAREQFIKDGYIIEKKSFHDAVENISDKHRAEMSVEYSIHCKVEDGTRHAIMNWKAFQKVAQKFIDIGKAEAVEKYKQSWFNEGKIAGRFEGLTEDEKYQQGVHDGKEEALKDLPRWRKCADGPKPKPSNEWIFSIDSENVTRESAIVHKGYFLPLDGLEKLPGFKED
jgi:hypothetical protein